MHAANPGTMRTVLFLVFVFIATDLFAQKECGSQSYLQSIKTSEVLTARNIDAAEMFIQQAVLKKKTTQFKLAADQVIRIPVVVHVLYYSDSYNISDAQIKSQLEALNRDFRRSNADTANTPDRFKPIAADVKIEFALATADPKGRSTNGIVRKKTGTKYWGMDDKIKFASSGGDDAWDSRYYLNIWIGDMRSYLGYSSLIGSAADKDGVVINTSVFGATGAGGNYNLGRTATHEVGHWLGLKHIWGDAYCGDDGVSDTPPQSGFTAGCPTTFKSTCNNGSLGDMYMNYMDLTNDACMNLFTKGQGERMRAAFEDGGPRQSILSSKGLNEPWVEETSLPGEEIAATTGLRLYPNPVSSELVLDFGDDISWVGKEVRLINMNGVIVQKIKIASKTHKAYLQGLLPGVYFIQGENSGKKINKKLVKL